MSKQKFNKLHKRNEFVEKLFSWKVKMTLYPFLLFMTICTIYSISFYLNANESNSNIFSFLYKLIVWYAFISLIYNQGFLFFLGIRKIPEEIRTLIKLWKIWNYKTKEFLIILTAISILFVSSSLLITHYTASDDLGLNYNLYFIFVVIKQISMIFGTNNSANISNILNLCLINISDKNKTIYFFDGIDNTGEMVSNTLAKTINFFIWWNN